jgi:hypothetical protein
MRTMAESRRVSELLGTDAEAPAATPVTESALDPTATAQAAEAAAAAAAAAFARALLAEETGDLAAAEDRSAG